MTTSCEAWAIRKRWPLQRGIDRAGPCPVCGGSDRFAIHTKKNTFNCRGCGISGAGVIDLVMKTEPCEFVSACEIITGRKAEAEVDPVVSAQMREQAERAQAKRAAEEDERRADAIKRAKKICRRGWPVDWADEKNPVNAYLRKRGIAFDANLHPKLGYIADHRWVEKQGSTWVTVHEGPAMIAAIRKPDYSVGAVHMTWIDLAQPNGKLVLPPAADGSERAVKKVIGSKKGGAIRLFTPPRATRMVMGEGIETTLTALAHAFEPGTAYWAGVDLGNMSGRAARSATGGQIWGEPDMADEDCVMPPDWCDELVYLCDSDEASTHTEEKVVRGLRRAVRRREAMRDGGVDIASLEASYVPPLGEGRDLNDLVRVAT